jgi:hypothetical protein
MLTHPVSGGAKWTKSYPSFDRISHPFGCLYTWPSLDKRILHLEVTAPRKETMRRVIRALAPTLVAFRLSQLHMHKERWTSPGRRPSWGRDEQSMAELLVINLSSIATHIWAYASGSHGT